MSAADLQTLPGLHGGVLKVHIVQLDLHHLHLGVFRENLIQNLGLVMEGKTHMPNLPLLAQLQRGLVSPAALVLLKDILILGMHQVEVEILHSAGFQLALKQRPDLLLALEVVVGQLVGQHIAFPGMAGGQASADGRLALAVQVAVGGVKIVKTRLQEGIHHAGKLLPVHLAVLHGQAHTAEAEISLHLIKLGKHSFFLLLTFFSSML